MPHDLTGAPVELVHGLEAVRRCLAPGYRRIVWDGGAFLLSGEGLADVRVSPDLIALVADPPDPSPVCGAPGCAEASRPHDPLCARHAAPYHSPEPVGRGSLKNRLLDVRGSAAVRAQAMAHLAALGTVEGRDAALAWLDEHE